ncbi:MAG: hypothetical protein M1497_13575 [Nitrospirae bacterium]|nr:hypothetical protein [Nitrospirota bacterium]
MRIARVLKRSLTDPLLDALAGEADPSTRKFFLSVLAAFRTDIVPEAARRLNDARWYVVRNMIYLIRECGGIQHVGRVKPLAKHPDKRISVEATKTLLHFGIPGAFPYVRFFLQSKDLELRDQIIRLAGAYKVREAVPYLLEILERKDLFGIELHYKLSVVRALGEIGDPRALDALMRLCRARSLLYRSRMEEIRGEILKSLSQYPPASVRPLLERGLTSRDKEIRTMSEKFLRNKGEGHDREGPN